MGLLSTRTRESIEVVRLSRAERASFAAAVAPVAAGLRERLGPEIVESLTDG